MAQRIYCQLFGLLMRRNTNNEGSFKVAHINHNINQDMEEIELFLLLFHLDKDMYHHHSDDSNQAPLQQKQIFTP